MVVPIAIGIVVLVGKVGGWNVDQLDYITFMLILKSYESRFRQKSSLDTT